MSAPAQAARPATLPVDVLIMSPAETVTELQVICLFRSDASNTLHGSLTEMNQKLQGLLERVRSSSASNEARFLGELGETLRLHPGLELSPHGNLPPPSALAILERLRQRG